MKKSISIVILLLAGVFSADAEKPRNQQAALQAGQHVALESVFHWRECMPEHVHHPVTTDEVADLVDILYRDKKTTGRDYFIRSSHQYFYLHNNFSCTDVGESSTVAIMLDLSRMNQVLHLDKDKGVITVQAGIAYEDLEEYLLDQDLSLPGWVVSPPFAGMSMAAALETASHGSSLDGPASIASYLESAVLVDGTGQTLALESPGDLLEGSLGLLGVITELTFHVSPARKAAVKEVQQEDLRMLEDIREVIEQSKAMALDITWSPAASLYTARIWHEVDPATPGNAVNGHIVAPNDWLEKVETLLTQDQEDQQGSSQGFDIMCEVIGDMTSFPTFTPYLPNAHGSPSRPAATSAQPGDDGPSEEGLSIGWINRMGSARCISPSSGGDCLWRRSKLTPHTVSIASEDLALWVDDVRTIMGYSAACPSFLIHFRFVLESEAPIAMSSGKQVISINIQSVSSLGYDGKLPIKHQDLLDEILQLSLCKYRGRPHWALSTNRMLMNSCGVRKAYGASFGRFMERQRMYDPEDVFLHPMFMSIAAQAGPTLYPGCALKEDCFCVEDEHCGPGFQCVPGKAFPEYSVCRMWGNEMPADEL